MSTTLADTARALDGRLARADLARFLSACYYEPAPEFAEERLFDSMAAAAGRVDADLALDARRLGEAFARDSLEDLLIDYTRLFLCPGHVRPYASAWLVQATAAQDTTAAVLAMYAEGGFGVDAGFQDLPDHIAAELEFVYLLLYHDRPGDLRKRFAGEHLGRWVRPFSDVMHADAGTAFYRQLAHLTQRMVAMEASLN